MTGSWVAAGAVLGLVLWTGCSSAGKASRGGAGSEGGGRDAAAVSSSSGGESLDGRVEAHARFAAGVIHEVRGDAAEATTNYWQAAWADLGNEELVRGVAQRLLAERSPERAVELLGAAARRKDVTGQTLGWLGLALVQAGKTNEAVSVFRSAIAKAPDRFMAYHGLAQLHFQAGATNAALAVLDQAEARPQPGARFLVDLAGFLTLAGRSRALPVETVTPRVGRILERAAALNPVEPDILQPMAEIYRARGELAEAARMYEGLLARQGGGNPAAMLALREQLVRLYVADNQASKAAEHLREILRVAPTNPQAHLLLGAIAAEEKQYPEAAESYERALLLDPDFAPAYYDLAAMQITLGQSAAALETLEKAGAKFPANFLLHFYRGVAHSSLKRYAEAIQDYTAAEILARVSEPARLNHIFYFQMGAACERLSGEARRAGRVAEADAQFAEGERHMRKSLELAPDTAETLNYLGYMWAERGVNLTEAEAMIRKALEAEPESEAILDSMAWVLHQQKRSAEALPYMERAVAKSEKPDATLLDHLGDILAALGRKAEAREAWKRSLEVEESAAVRAKLESEPGGDRSTP
ncbi:MAG TPA: tetratricopeptide repeat protein [Verrucomicrobiota bacterium]|nr:tetratricopeptide repeat protein [Verrucomicrobiota bacterium]HNU51002.1 tetratricopeptide repeat protein [Verrucomicrobiota bacterium]